MKKAALIFLLFVVASSLKAQHIFHFQPLDCLSGNNNNAFKIMPLVSFNKNNRVVDYHKIFNYSQSAVELSNLDKMPVITLEGSSKMGVFKPEGYYTMPVKMLNETDLNSDGRNLLPGLPTFFKP